MYHLWFFVDRNSLFSREQVSHHGHLSQVEDKKRAQIGR
jgi:hypothetical protein